MPKMIVATDKFPYGKTTYRRGAEVDMEDRYVELFLESGKLRWPEGAKPNASDLPAEVMTRASKRAPVTEFVDSIKAERLAAWESGVKSEPLTEEDAPVAEKAMKAEAVEEDKAPKAQTYHRRDLVAEKPKAKPGPKPKQPPVEPMWFESPAKKKPGRPAGKGKK